MLSFRELPRLWKEESMKGLSSREDGHFEASSEALAKRRPGFESVLLLESCQNPLGS